MMQVLWQQLTAAGLRERASPGAIVLLPVASTEQHGPHLGLASESWRALL